MSASVDNLKQACPCAVAHLLHLSLQVRVFQDHGDAVAPQHGAKDGGALKTGRSAGGTYQRKSKKLQTTCLVLSPEPLVEVVLGVGETPQRLARLDVPFRNDGGPPKESPDEVPVPLPGVVVLLAVCREEDDAVGVGVKRPAGGGGGSDPTPGTFQNVLVAKIFASVQKGSNGGKRETHPWPLCICKLQS